MRRYGAAILLLFLYGILCHLTSSDAQYGAGAGQCRAQAVMARPFPFFYQLYSNEITSVHQDREGYIWLGTTDGVMRYDGHRLVTFRNDFATPRQLIANRVECVNDNKRFVWIGTNRGVTLFDKLACTMRQLDVSRSVNDVAVDAAGRAWVAAGDKAKLYSPDGKLIKAYSLNPKREITINHIYIDRQQRVWVVAYGGLYLYDKRHDNFRKYPPLGRDDSPFTICQDSEGNFWLGTWGEGLWRFHPEHHTPAECYQRQSMKVSGTSIEDNDAFCIMQDDAMGYLWVLSYKQLHTFKPRSGKLEPVDIDCGIDPHMMFTMIAKDREGNLWLGSYDMGYNIFFNQSGIVNHTMPRLKAKLGWDANLVNLIADGDVAWTSQDRYGLLLYNTSTGDISDHHLPIGEVSHIKRSPKGGVWLKSRFGEKIYKAERHGMDVAYTQEIRLGNIIANPGRISDFAEDAAGNLWILTSNNIFVCSRQPEQGVSVGSRLPAFNTLVSDGKGTTWCFADSVLYGLRLHRSAISTISTTPVTLLSDDEKVTKCCIDGGGRLWFSTSYGRIICSDHAKRHFHDTRLGQQVTDAPVLSIVAEGNSVWIVTSKKILLCNPEGKLVRQWKANEGNVKVQAFRQNAVCTDSKGGIMAGGHGGFVSIPATHNQHVGAGSLKNIVVTDVTVNDSSVMFARNDCPGQHNTRCTVSLLPYDRNVRVFFSALTYSLDPPPAFCYKLEGVDKDWVTASDNTCSAFYNQLPAGEYHFLVRCQLPDGQWGKPVDALVVIQKPVFYKTTWAYIIYILSLAAVVFLCVRNRGKIRYVAEKLQTVRKMYAGKMKLSVIGGTGSVEPAAINASNEFMAKVMEEIKEHISESEFGTDQLAEKLSMSRSTLYRRVTSAIGITPADLIRRVQLERACELLEDQRHNISEIAYAVGFANPKYFAKCFKDEFGITPSEYLKHHKTVHSGHDKA